MLTTATSADDPGELEALPTPTVETDPAVEPVPARPRPKRDYNYFADLRKALAELQEAKEGRPAAGDDVA
jgi:hypothetical protein